MVERNPAEVQRLIEKYTRQYAASQQPYKPGQASPAQRAIAREAGFRLISPQPAAPQAAREAQAPSSEPSGEGEAAREERRTPISLVPEPPPAPTRQFYIPLLDPSRQPTSELGQHILWRGPRGQAVQLGDILPNLQQSLRPLTRPLETTQERAGGHGLGRAMRSAGVIGAAVAGVPEAAIESFNIPSQIVKHGVGVAAQAAGVSPQLLLKASPISVAVEAGREIVQDISPFIRRVAVGLLRGLEERGSPREAAFFRRQAEKLENWQDSPTAIEEAIATAIVWGQRFGRDTTQLERALDLLAPGRRQELVETARGLAEEAGKITREAYTAAHFSYENANRLLEARRRLEAGEDWPGVQADIEQSLTTRERVRSLAYEMLLDPLNLVGIDLPAKMAEQGGSRFVRSAVREGEDYVRAFERVRQTLEETRRLEPLRGVERLPLVGQLVRRLPRTESGRLVEQTASTIAFLSSHIDDQAAARLAEMGINADPRLLVIHLLADPTSNNVMKTGISADEIVRALNLQPFPADAAASKALGVPEGTIINLLESEAAMQSRVVLERLAPMADKIAEVWSDVESAYRQAYRAGRGMPFSARRRAFREAMSQADARLASLFGLLQDTADKITGVKEPPTGLPGAILDFFRRTQGMMAQLHMNLSPGWLIRNIIQNHVMAWSDGATQLKGLGMLDDWMARHDMFVPGMRRELGGRADARVQRSFGLYGPNAAVENNMRQRIYVSGVERVFQRHWRTGELIPEGAVDELAAAVGDEWADRIVGQVVRARSISELNEALSAIKTNEMWRLLTDELIHKLNAIEPGLADVVQDILTKSDDLIEATSRLARISARFEQSVEDALKTWHALPGSAEAVQVDDFLTYMRASGWPEDVQSKVWDEFNRRVAIQVMAVSYADNWTAALLNQLDELDPAAASRMAARRNEIVGLNGAINRHYQATFARRDAMTRALRAGNIQAVRAFPEFADAPDIPTAWEMWPAVRDSMWEQARASALDDLLKLGDEIANVIAQYGVRPAYPRPTRIIDELQLTAPFTREQQRIMMHQLQLAAHEAGINNLNHLTNFIKKYNPGLISADRRVLQAADIINEAWYNEALNTIRQYAQGIVQLHLPNQSEIADLLDDLLEHGAYTAVYTGGNPMNTIERASAFQLEATRVLDEVVEHISRNANRGDLFSPDQTAVVRAFIDSLKPRLTAIRTIAQQVGKSLADYVLFNYADRRAFDTAFSVMFSYPFWYTRNIAHWVRNAWARPGAVAVWTKIWDALQRANTDKPAWWREQIGIDTPLGTMYFPILNTVSPLKNIFGDKFTDPARENTLIGAWISEMGNYGPSIHVVPQTILALSAALRGNREEAISWMGYLSQPSRTLNVLTVLAREAGLKVIPPGGIPALEWWMFDFNTGRFTGTKWEQRRLAKTLIDMWTEGLVTQEQARDAIYLRQGDVYDQALQRMRVSTATQVLLSWIGGAGLHMRPESEIQIAEMDAAALALIARRPAEYGGTSPDAMTPEEYRLAWRELENKYPFIDLVYLSRRTGDQRDARYVWMVMNSLPPNASDYLRAVGLEPDSLDRWYETQFNDMSPAERRDFINKMIQLGAILQMPSDATQNEWLAAKDAYQALRRQLEREFGDGIFDIEDAYYDVRDNAGSEAARRYLEDHPELELMWRRRDELKINDPLLVRYYGSMSLIERAMRAQFDDEMAARFPGLDPGAFWDEYRRRAATDPDAAAALWDEFPQMQEYLNALDAWTLQLRDRLTEMADSLGALEGHFAELRRDAPEVEQLTPGQARVRDMILNASRPLGDFELPEDLDERELQAAINLEYSSIPPDQVGAVFRSLREMGRLDQTLRSFLDWGRGQRGLQSIEGHTVELRALLVAMESIRNEGGWTLVAAEEEVKRLIGKQLPPESIRFEPGGTGTGQRNVQLLSVTREMDDQIENIAKFLDGTAGLDAIHPDLREHVQALADTGVEPILLARYLKLAMRESKADNDYLMAMSAELRDSVRLLGEQVIAVKTAIGKAYSLTNYVRLEVQDIGTYIADALRTGDWLNEKLGRIDRDVRPTLAELRNAVATSGQRPDVKALTLYLESVVSEHNLDNEYLVAQPAELRDAVRKIGQALIDEIGRRARSSSGGGGRGVRQRSYAPRTRVVRSLRYGGHSTKPRSEVQQQKQHEAVHAFLTTLRERSPLFWSWLRLMADMSRNDAQAFINDPARAHFKRWLVNAVFPVFGSGMGAIMDYFRDLSQTRGASHQQRTDTRAQIQRFAVRY